MKLDHIKILSIVTDSQTNNTEVVVGVYSPLTEKVKRLDGMYQISFEDAPFNSPDDFLDRVRAVLQEVCT